MAKFEGMTVTQLLAKVEELKASGVTESQAIVAVEPGLLEGNPVIIGKGKDKSVSCFAVTYKRNGVDKFFKGIYFDAKHLSNAKSYNNLSVGIDDDKLLTMREQANMSKTYSLRAESYTTADARKVTTVKLEQ